MSSRTLLRRPEVIRRTGLSRSTLWRMERAGQFPAHVLVTDTVIGWFADEVDAWIRDRVRAGDSARRPPRANRTGGSAAA